MLVSREEAYLPALYLATRLRNFYLEKFSENFT